MYNWKVFRGLIYSEKSNHNNFLFSSRKESVCIRKKWVSVNNMGHILMEAFCNTGNDFHMEIIDVWYKFWVEHQIYERYYNSHIDL